MNENCISLKLVCRNSHSIRIEITRHSKNSINWFSSAMALNLFILQWKFLLGGIFTSTIGCKGEGERGREGEREIHFPIMGVLWSLIQYFSSLLEFFQIRSPLLICHFCPYKACKKAVLMELSSSAKVSDFSLAYTCIKFLFPICSVINRYSCLYYGKFNTLRCTQLFTVIILAYC